MAMNPLHMPVPPAVAPLAVRPREAARLLGISVSSLERLTRTGEIPRVKHGNKVFYRVASLEDWLARQEAREMRGLT